MAHHSTAAHARRDPRVATRLVVGILYFTITQHLLLVPFFILQPPAPALWMNWIRARPATGHLAAVRSRAFVTPKTVGKGSHVVCRGEPRRTRDGSRLRYLCVAVHVDALSVIVRARSVWPNPPLARPCIFPLSSGLSCCRAQQRSRMNIFFIILLSDETLHLAVSTGLSGWSCTLVGMSLP